MPAPRVRTDAEAMAALGEPRLKLLERDVASLFDERQDQALMGVAAKRAKTTQNGVYKATAMPSRRGSEAPHRALPSMEMAWALPSKDRMKS